MTDETFTVGDLVRFPNAAHWNRTQDYQVKQVDDTGYGVVAPEYPAHCFPVSNDEALRLGMTHSPNQPG
jgi:hypothetical protein